MVLTGAKLKNLCCNKSFLHVGYLLSGEENQCFFVFKDLIYLYHNTISLKSEIAHEHKLKGSYPISFSASEYKIYAPKPIYPEKPRHQ